MLERQESGRGRMESLSEGVDVGIGEVGGMKGKVCVMELEVEGREEFSGKGEPQGSRRRGIRGGGLRLWNDGLIK
jgi:hypothetical protein